MNKKTQENTETTKWNQRGCQTLKWNQGNYF
jgi:hypothetical protein